MISWKSPPNTFSSCKPFLFQIVHCYSWKEPTFLFLLLQGLFSATPALVFWIFIRPKKVKYILSIGLFSLMVIHVATQEWRKCYDLQTVHWSLHSILKFSYGFIYTVHIYFEIVFSIPNSHQLFSHLKWLSFAFFSRFSINLLFTFVNTYTISRKWIKK